MEQFATLVLVDGQPDEAADGHAAAAGVGEAEGVGGIFELTDLPADIPLLVAVHHLDAREESVVERSLKRILTERPLHEVEPAAAREMLVAEGVFLVADADGAEQGHVPDLHPEVGHGRDRTGVTLRRIDLVVDVELVDEVVFAGPVVELIHPALDAEPRSPQGHRIGEFRVEAALVRRLVGARGGREGHGVDLRAAADLDAEILVGRLGLEGVGPLRLVRRVGADLVGIGRLVGVVFSSGRLVGGGQRLGRGLLLQFLQPRLERRDPLPLGLDRLRHFRKRSKTRGDALNRKGLNVGVIRQDDELDGDRRGGPPQACHARQRDPYRAGVAQAACHGLASERPQGPHLPWAAWSEEAEQSLQPSSSEPSAVRLNRILSHRETQPHCLAQTAPLDRIRLTWNAGSGAAKVSSPGRGYAQAPRAFADPLASLLKGAISPLLPVPP